MTDFIVTITDQAQLDGITWAREQYNASLPQPAPPDTVMGGMSNSNGAPPPEIMPMADVPTPLETDEEYIQYVMEQASISYADQKLRAEHRQNYEDAAAAAGRKAI